MSADRPVLYRLEDGVAVITLNRPHRLNAVNADLVEELCGSLDRAVHDDVGAVVLTGAGRSFSAGHDLKEPRRNEPDVDARRRLQRLQDVTRKTRQASFPVIAAVTGFALGAGCEWALGCDLVVAGEGAVFGFPEVGVGLGVTGGISHLLPTTVGPAKAKELVLLGARFSAAEAERLGLVNLVVDDEDVVARALAWARELQARPRLALAMAKSVLDRGAQTDIDGAYELEIAASLALRNTDEAHAATARFRQGHRQ
jgi:2-(1,2-epoxy-1,2-dihydrophenyl)acetyl-CoA isomerase